MRVNHTSHHGSDSRDNTDASMAGLPQYFTAADHFEELKDGMTRAGAMTQNARAMQTHFDMIT
jgi:hypothetical protein